MPTKKCKCGRPIKNEVYGTCGIHDPTGYHMRAKARKADEATKAKLSGVAGVPTYDKVRRKIRKALKRAKKTRKVQVVAVQKKRKVKLSVFGKPGKGRSHWVPKFSSEMGDAFRIICMRCVDRKKEAAKLHARVDTLLDMGTDAKTVLAMLNSCAVQNEVEPKVEQMIQANWAQLKTIRLEKGLAYAEEGDPYSNYRMAGGEEYIIRRMIEKCARALRRCATGKPVDMETWGDLTNMAMILGIYGKVYEK